VNTSTPIYTIIVAGGQGVRMGTALPKQFLEIDGKPILYYTLQAFIDALPEQQLVLVLPAHQLSYAQVALQHLPDSVDITLVAGGETRFHSVQNGLKAVGGEGIVLVHDGVRPLVSPELIRRCCAQAQEKGSAVPAIPVADSMRMVQGDSSEPVDRGALRIIQTPQTFRTDILLPAFRQPWQEGFTDEATVVEAYGEKVFLVEGERTNIKITTPEDLRIAEALLKDRKERV
jgi:2-C-methyl-D-erythritol 4-phosphate cytidylyltransferase